VSRKFGVGPFARKRGGRNITGVTAAPIPPLPPPSKTWPSPNRRPPKDAGASNAAAEETCSRAIYSEVWSLRALERIRLPP